MIKVLNKAPAKKTGRKKASKPVRLPEQSEWTFELIEQVHAEIKRVAEDFGLEKIKDTEKDYL